jgi:hypothetical protein
VHERLLRYAVVKTTHLYLGPIRKVVGMYIGRKRLPEALHPSIPNCMKDRAHLQVPNADTAEGCSRKYAKNRPYGAVAY